MDIPKDFKAFSLDHLSEQDREGLFYAFNQAATTSVRINPRKFDRLFPLNSIPWELNAFILPERPKFTLDPLFHAGAYYVQESSSMFLAEGFRQISELQNPILALDLCAAPGGKSTHLLDVMPKGSFLLSNEINEARSSVLRDNLTKWGRLNCCVSNNSADEIAQLDLRFDFILVDAPCSGEGMFHDEIARAEWNENNVRKCSYRQKEIISTIWPSLREGGIMLYSTCTFNQFENEENIKWLKSQHDCEVIDLDISEFEGVVNHELKGIRGYRFYPGKVPGDGLFYCWIRKLEKGTQPRSKKLKWKNETKQFSDWINPEQVFTLKKNDHYYAIPLQQADLLPGLFQLRLKKLGICIGSYKKTDLIPHHELALSTDFNFQFQEIDLSLMEALQYLRKGSVLPKRERGFHRVKYRENGLGWAKSIGNRWNNNLPKHLSIRMDIPKSISEEDLWWIDIKG